MTELDYPEKKIANLLKEGDETKEIDVMLDGCIKGVVKSEENGEIELTFLFYQPFHLFLLTKFTPEQKDVHCIESLLQTYEAKETFWELTNEYRALPSNIKLKGRYHSQEKPHIICHSIFFFNSPYTYLARDFERNVVMPRND